MNHGCTSSVVAHGGWRVIAGRGRFWGYAEPMPAPKYPWGRPAVKFMTGPKRDRKIVQLRKAGYSMRAIGKEVGLSVGGVHAALERIAAGAGE